MFTIMVKKRPGWINSFQTYLTFGYFPISRKSSFKLDFQDFGHQSLFSSEVEKASTLSIGMLVQSTLIREFRSGRFCS